MLKVSWIESTIHSSKVQFKIIILHLINIMIDAGILADEWQIYEQDIKF